MPEGWEVVENPVYFVTGDPYGDNAVGFRSKLSPDADWIYVEVKESNTTLTWVPETKLFPQSELRNLDQLVKIEDLFEDLYQWRKQLYLHLLAGVFGIHLL